MAKEDDTITISITPGEHAVILAGLRLLQRERGKETAPGGRTDITDFINEILTNCGTIKPLTNRAIDRLCERINA